MVHREGTQVLYGEQHFDFTFNHLVRGELKTVIGYKVRRYKTAFHTASINRSKDVYRFFNSIGLSNIMKLRSVGLTFQDALGRGKANGTPESRRYWISPHLLKTLQCLVDHGRLERLQLRINGVRRLKQCPSTYKLLDLLSKIQCDALYWGWGPYLVKPPLEQMEWHKTIDQDIRRDLERLMVRKKKLYLHMPLSIERARGIDELLLYDSTDDRLAEEIW